MLIDSPYTKIKTSKDQLLHTGYDYRYQVMRRTLSNVLYRSNGTFTAFLDKINAVVYELIESVKRIKTFANPALDKNERRIN